MRLPFFGWAPCLTSVLSALMIFCRPAAGAPSGQFRDQVRLREGERRTFDFPNPVSIAVQDTAIASATVTGPAKVTIVGLAAGETWVEISYGTRQWSALRVAVAPEHGAGAQHTERLSPPPGPSSSNDPAAEDSGAPTLVVTPPSPKFRVAVGARYGYDKADAVQREAGVLLVQSRRIFIGQSTISFRARETTSLELTVPYVHQTARVTSRAGSASARGHGMGDLTFLVEQRWPELLPGIELAIAAGTLFPTGTDAFNAAVNELPTGTGFYQPFGRITLSKSIAPLRVYAVGEYGGSISRRVRGEHLRLDHSYGIEAGFLYNLSPEFLVQTSANFAQVSSPFIAGENSAIDSSKVGYLRQSLIYRMPSHTTVQGSVMLGLTEDSIDAFFSLDVSQEF
jgi:hypothetical protein